MVPWLGLRAWDCLLVWFLSLHCLLSWFCPLFMGGRITDLWQLKNKVDVFLGTVSLQVPVSRPPNPPMCPVLHTTSAPRHRSLLFLTYHSRQITASAELSLLAGDDGALSLEKRRMMATSCERHTNGTSMVTGRSPGRGDAFWRLGGLTKLHGVELQIRAEDKHKTFCS